MKTRDKILRTALRMFNDKGVHGVGVRDIARALEMSPGNLQYHFAKKDHLVAELVRQLHAANNERVDAVGVEEVSFHSVYALTLGALRGHIAYRGIMLSYAEVVSKSPELQLLAAEMDETRPSRYGAFIEKMIENGYLDAERIRGREEEVRQLGEALGRFWLPAAVLNGEANDLEGAAERHARLMLHFWEPYATERGREQLAQILG